METLERPRRDIAGKRVHKPFVGLGILVYWGWVVTSSTFENAERPASVATAAAATLMLGAVWQLVNPRDLANRFVVIAVFAGLLPVAVMALGSIGGSVSAQSMRTDSTHFWTLLPLVSGVVLAEHFLRWRIVRARRRARAALA